LMCFTLSAKFLNLALKILLFVQYVAKTLRKE
jgi:hypothetical protein